MTPLFVTAQSGNLLIVKWILASGRKINIHAKCKTNDRTPSTQAAIKGFPEITSLINEFEAKPNQTATKLRIELGISAARAAKTFALIVFLCDEYLSPRAVDHGFWQFTTTALSGSDRKTLRFFKITTCLPMELQMLLCNLLVDCNQDIILTKDSEPAFQNLAKTQ